MSLYAVCGKDGQPRHVVRVVSDADEKGRVKVEVVGLHPSVEGLARRGKTPKFNTGVKQSELVPLEEEVQSQFEATASSESQN